MCPSKGQKTRSAKKEIYEHQIGVVIDLGFFTYGDICPNFYLDTKTYPPLGTVTSFTYPRFSNMIYLMYVSQAFHFIGIYKF
jgi:hypothetical protein